MGGLVTRYTLARMERENKSHDVEIYISGDSPHKGANIPLGGQSLALFTGKDSKEFKSLMRPASVQMLYQNILAEIMRGNIEVIDDETPVRGESKYLNLRTAFLNEYEDLGFPNNVIKLGLSNGSPYPISYSSQRKHMFYVETTHDDNTIDVRATAKMNVFSVGTNLGLISQINGGVYIAGSGLLMEKKQLTTNLLRNHLPRYTIAPGSLRNDFWQRFPGTDDDRIGDIIKKIILELKNLFWNYYYSKILMFIHLEIAFVLSLQLVLLQWIPKT